MNILRTLNQYEQIIEAQIQCLSAISKINSIDHTLANHLFSISKRDSITLSASEDKYIQQLPKLNSQLFKFSFSPENIVANEENTIISSITYVSQLVKNTVVQYKEGQLKAIINLKEIIDSNKNIAKLLFSIKDDDIYLIKKKLTTDLIFFANRYKWCFELNNNLTDVISNTAMLSNQSKSFVESTLIY